MPLPESTIRDILARLGIHDAGPIEPVFGGLDTEIWRVQHGEHASALRIFRPDQVEPAAAEREALEAVAGIIPVPELLGSGFWDDRPVSLIAWCAGNTLGATLMSEPGRAWELGRVFGEMQARLHQIEAPPALPDARHAWPAWTGVPLPERAIGNQLLHLDFHPMNVMIDGDTVSGVIDWTNAAAGDPRLDAARTVAILSAAGSADLEIDFDDFEAIRSSLIEGWQTGYESIAGPLADFLPFLIWAGQATAADLTRKPDDIPGVAEMAARLLALVDVWSNPGEDDDFPDEHL